MDEVIEVNEKTKKAKEKVTEKVTKEDKGEPLSVIMYSLFSSESAESYDKIYADTAHGIIANPMARGILRSLKSGGVVTVAIGWELDEIRGIIESACEKAGVNSDGETKYRKP